LLREKGNAAWTALPLVNHQLELNDLPASGITLFLWIVAPWVLSGCAPAVLAGLLRLLLLLMLLLLMLLMLLLTRIVSALSLLRALLWIGHLEDPPQYLSSC
jgi:hypothetical protein